MAQTYNKRSDANASLARCICKCNKQFKNKFTLLRHQNSVCRHKGNRNFSLYKTNIYIVFSNYFQLCIRLILLLVAAEKRAESNEPEAESHSQTPSESRYSGNSSIEFNKFHETGGNVLIIQPPKKRGKLWSSGSSTDYLTHFGYCS